MKSTSVISLVNWKRRIKYSFFLVAGVIILGVLATNNPSPSKAFPLIDSGPNNRCTFDLTHPGPMPDLDCENRNIIINRVSVVISGYHEFDSMIIINGGSLTHAALDTGDFNPISYELNASGLAKTVNMKIKGELQFRDAGSRIDVSYKGYPGGGDSGGATCTTKVQRGFGPGGSSGITRWANLYLSAGGAGYGGRGGNGNDADERTTAFCSGTPSFCAGDYYGGSFYGDVSDAQQGLWHGSGGGSACGAGPSLRYGYAGGGRVKLEAYSISSDNSAGTGIYADGDSVNSPQPNYWGGPGSGGGIQITFTSSAEMPLMYSVRGGNSGIRPDACAINCQQEGNIGHLRFENINSSGNVVNISANGGNGRSPVEPPHGAGGGGGGRIMIVQKLAGNVQKKLEPIERGGVSASIVSFNPYALQKGDRIGVRIKVGSLTVGEPVKLTDDALVVTGGGATGGGAMCKPVIGSAVPNTAESLDKVEWTLPANSSVMEFFYECIVD